LNAGLGQTEGIEGELWTKSKSIEWELCSKLAKMDGCKVGGISKTQSTKWELCAKQRGTEAFEMGAAEETEE